MLSTWVLALQLLLDPASLAVLGIGLTAAVVTIGTIAELHPAIMLALVLCGIPVMAVLTGAAMTLSQMRSGTVYALAVRGCREHRLCRWGLPAVARAAVEIARVRQTAGPGSLPASA